MVSYGRHTWNEQDLFESEMTLCQLVIDDGVAFDKIEELDQKGYFGGLDVSSVLEKEGLIP